MDIDKISELGAKAQKDIGNVATHKDLEQIRVTYLGRKSELAQFLRSVKDLSGDEKKRIGQIANDIRKKIEIQIAQRELEFQSLDIDSKITSDTIDISAPGKKKQNGHLHPLTHMRREVEEIFRSMGFAVAQGPEIESEWNNFDALNMPEDHAARTMQDTFWLNIDKKDKKKPSVLRTHTTAVDVRHLENYQPPFRIIIPGRVFRNEATDITHEMQFYQFDSLMVDRDISLAHLKGVVTYFFKKFFKDNVDVRFVSSYFPFTEPSVEIFIKGTKGALKDRWIEVAGAGMLHQNVFKATGYSPREWTGLAFGMTMDRLIMLRNKVDDVRLLYGSDLRFLNQF